MSSYIAVASTLFALPVDSAADWRPVVFAIIWFTGSIPITIYMLAHPALLRRRFFAGPFAERETSQRILIALVFVCFAALATVIIADVHFGWSSVPAAVTVAGDVLVGAGLLLVLLVFSVNQFAAATVQVEEGQKVVSSGPYALVRHPLYSAGILLILGVPPAIGSWWGLALFPPLLALIIWRLTDEERYLIAHLPGYQDYRQRVRYRLIPGVW
jgi:protein-S-isoprenylcysteine O-methyltransferase Ste14